MRAVRESGERRRMAGVPEKSCLAAKEVTQKLGYEDMKAFISMVVWTM